MSAGRRTVLVTGASTGIGHATAKHLGASGFDVRAGVRKPADAERLEREPGVTPVTIDVTDTDSIAAAAATLPDELYGLVNNAGVAVNAPVEYVPLDELRRQLEVNLVGQVAVTQAVLGRVRAAQGRVLFVTSVGGRIALPLFAPYAASKFGLEAVADAMRRETRDQGIEVIVIQPGGTATPIWDRGAATADAMRAEMPPEAGQRYGRMMEILQEEAVKAAKGKAGAVPPEYVAKKIGRALTAEKPKIRYPSRDARVAIGLQRLLGDRAFDWIVARPVLSYG
ncbi:MAG: SDR family NAD(P)-dependent oxidoreductase [Thermoleophilaceae bacterium]|nr:SDR family NAD(P)-dependent oxidoreductase [Thermoleophilaceae bacterium]